MQVKKLIEQLQKLDPDDVIWATWITKDNIVEAINQSEFTDEQDNLIQITNKDIDDDFCISVGNSIDNDDYLWERFNEDFDESVRELFLDFLKEKEKVIDDVELWEK